MTLKASVLPNGRTQFFNNAGAPVAGGSVGYYIPTTMNFKDTWQNPEETTLNLNPVPLDAAGSALIWGVGAYRMIVKDSTGVVIYDVETYGAGSGSTSSAGFGELTAIVADTTTDLGSVASHNAIITGTTPIANFGNSASLTAPVWLVMLDAGCTVLASSSILMPFGQSYTFRAGDSFLCEYLGGGVWRVIAIWPAGVSTFGPTPEQFGAIGDGVVLNDGAIVAAAVLFSSPLATFTQQDVGKTIGILGAGAVGATGAATHITTIAAWVSATQVNLTDAAVTTVANAHYVYGTNDTTAMQAFYAGIAGITAAFSANKIYISKAALSGIPRLVQYNASRLVFLLPNIVDNCLQLGPPHRSVATAGEAGAKFSHQNLWIDAMCTGLDALFINDGAPELNSLVIENSGRDAVRFQSNGSTPAGDTFIENLTGYNWLMVHCGRHACHLYLSGDGVSNVTPVFINESNIYAWEIRGVGRRYAGANALRLTYDNVSAVLLAANKVEHFYVYGGNWDAQVANSLGGNSVGDVIYQNCINGTTGREVEQLRFWLGGVESTVGAAVGPPKLINGNALATGDWILCHFEAELYQWGFDVNANYLASPADNNTFWNTTGTLGTGGHAQNLLPIFKLPVDGRSIVSTDVAPNGGIIDANLKNSLTPYIGFLTLVASATATLDIPIQPVPKVANSIYQWPVKVIVSINPYFDSTAYWAYGEFTVLLTYNSGTDAVSVAKVTGTTKVPGDVTVSFTPAADVSFSVVSSSGTLRDRLRVSIAGGANVGAAGAEKRVQIAASRFGFGVSEIQRQNIAPALEMGFTV